jgi:hypothetical protein
MQTPPSRPTRTVAIGLRFALAALATLLGSACADGSEPGDDQARLAVVFTADDGRVQTVGSYDARSGELTFVPRAQVDMREHLADAGYSASVEHAGELAAVDLEVGVAVTLAELVDGDVLELRVDRAGMKTLVLGRLELQEDDEDLDADDTWRRLGNKVWQDDWLAPV